jgi:hypothetical protein
MTGSAAVKAFRFRHSGFGIHIHEHRAVEIADHLTDGFDMAQGRPRPGVRRAAAAIWHSP